MAGACGHQLVVPSLEVVFSPDRLIRNMGRTNPVSLIWTTPGRDSSLRIWPGDGVTGVSLLVEHKPLLAHLRAHMSSEALEFPGLFDAWKGGLGALLQHCRTEMDRVVRDCTAATGMDYIGDKVSAGRFPTAPAYICRRSIWEHDPGDAPALEILLTLDDSWKLVPADYPAWTLATGERPNLEGCRQAQQAIIADRAPLPVWEDIRNRHHELDREGRILQDFLRDLIERGDIGGTCPLCLG
ncbi:MAG: hypothetical protein GY849_09505 [Deltaproteobacteria bacterium]|nr:hypothetical protein [Deltaproteobacteria bacterium]